MVINVFLLEDVNEVTANLYMALTELALFIKIANFFILVRGMQSLLHTMRNFRLQSMDEENLIKRRLSFFVKVSIYYYACANTVCLTSALSAVMSSEVKLPFYGWYGVDWKHNRQNYWSIFVYQMVGMVFTANENITIELFPMILMYMASVQMEILGRRMKVVGWNRNTLKSLAENNGYSNDDEISPDGLQDAHVKLIESIEAHKKICM